MITLFLKLLLIVALTIGLYVMSAGGYAHISKVANGDPHAYITHLITIYKKVLK